MSKKRSEGVPGRRQQWQTFKDGFRSCINSVESSGDFATSESVPNPVNLGITIDGIGSIRLPLSEAGAKAITEASRKAPFGKGQETLINESIRSTWEMQASDIHTLNPEWQSWVDGIVSDVTDRLGVGTTDVHAKLYKMHLYEKGDMFKRHQDTEKVDDMFGTLVICLPSEHTGSAVRLEHGYKSFHMQTEKNSAFNATYLAWYADVLHEIEPVLSVYRFCLTYNLVNVSKSTISSASKLHAQTESLVKALSPWSTLKKPTNYLGNYLVYPLQHQYSEQSSSIAKLKGQDRDRVRCIADACTVQEGYLVRLGHLEMTTTFDGEEGASYNGFDEKRSSLYLENVENLNRTPMTLFSRYEISYPCLLAGSDHYNRHPDEETGGEYQGNQHAEIDQVYRNSVVVIIPATQYTRSFLPQHISHAP